MKLIYIFLLIGFSLIGLADDNITIVAVGEAEKDHEGIYFDLSQNASLRAVDLKKLQSVMETLKSDFSFYKSRFRIDESSKKSRFNILLSSEIIEKTLWLKIQVRDTKAEKDAEPFQTRQKVWTNNLRSFSHDIADQIYQSIVGKKSIFKSKIAFVSDRTSTKKEIRKELYIMDFDGERKQRLTFQNSLVISPAISPDNKNVVFTLMDTVHRPSHMGGTVKIKNLNLYMLNLGKRNLTLISSAKGINSGAVFNKSGDSVYLTLSKNKNADIYKLDLKTRRAKRVTTHYSEDVDPHINANESLLTFLSGRPGKAMIYTMNPTKPEYQVKRISFVGDFNASPRFNPEGSEIVFSSWVDNRFDIYRIGSDGRNLVRLTKNFGSNEEPWYSPDGEFIIFSSQRVLSRKKAVQDLYIMDKDGEIIKKITSNYGKIFTPRWSN